MTPEYTASKLTGLPVHLWSNPEFLEIIMHSSTHQTFENENDGQGNMVDGYETIMQTYGEFLGQVKDMLEHFKLLEHG